MRKNIAIGYVRQSTTKQASLGWQEDIIRSEALKRSHCLEFVFSDKASGKGSERTGFSLMKENIATRKVSFLYVWRLDRISRNVSDLLEFHDYCSQYGVTIISIADPITAADDSMARFQISVVGSVAQLQRELIAENQRIGLRKKHEMGYHLSARVPFGYHYYNKDKIVIVKDEAKTVRMVYDLYIKGSGYKKICALCSSNGIMFRGKTFKIHNVRNILMNPFYSGYIENEFGQVKGVHPSIVTREMQKAVQKIQKTRHLKKKDFRRNLLRGKVCCPHCGKHLSIHVVGPNQKSRRYNKLYYYSCPTKGTNGKKACKGIHLQANEIEAQVVRTVITFLNDKEQLEPILSKMNTKVCNNREQASERMDSIESRKEAALDSFERGTFSAKQLADELNRLNQYKSDNEDDLQKDLMPNTVHLKELSKRLANLGTVQQMPTVQQYQFFQEIIDRVEIDSQKRVLGIYIKGLKKNILSEKKE